MLNKKSAFAFVTSFVLAASLLSGCGSSKDSGASSAAEGTGTSSKQVEFSFYYSGFTERGRFVEKFDSDVRRQESRHQG